MTLPIDSQDQWLSDISAGLTTAGGLKRGGTLGAVAAGTGAAKLGSNLGTFGSESGQIGAYAGEVGNIAGIYSGIKQGGVMGYGGAAINAAELYSKLGGAGGDALGEAVPYANAALSVYNFAENWQSGQTGGDALRGAEAGAAIGTMIVPGVGTVVGAVIGGAVGALSSAFGGGATDPETHNWQGFIDATGGANATQAQVDAATKNMSPQVAFNLLAGVMDIKDGRIPIVNAFGQMGESNLLNQMTTQINAAYKAGAIPAGATPQQIFKSVVTPWLNSKGATITPETGGLQLQAVLTSLIGSWQSGQLSSNTQLTGSGSKDTTLPTYAGLQAKQSPAAVAAATNVSTQLAGFGGQNSSGTTLAATLPMLTALMGASGGGKSGAPMADPNNPGAANPTTTNTDPGTDPNAGGGTGTGGDNSFLSGLSSFLSSPLGNAAEFGTLAAAGIAEAGSQRSENASLAGSISSQGQPFTAAGQGELSQITGGPQMGGPMGASISQQTGAAAELGKVAQDYGTGNLTAGQQAQVQQYVAQQKAQAASELAAAGITDPNSQQYQTAMQQIDNNALAMTQQLTTQNISTAEGALNAVQTTYSNLLNQSLSSASFGLGAQESAVSLQIQQDTALANQLQTLFAGIAQGFGNSLSGNKNNTGSAVAGVASGVGSVAGQVAKGVASSASGGGSGAPSADNPQETYEPTTGEWSSGYVPGGGSAPGTDYAPGVSTDQPPAGYQDPGTNPFGNVFDDSGSDTQYDYVSDPLGG